MAWTGKVASKRNGSNEHFWLRSLFHQSRTNDLVTSAIKWQTSSSNTRLHTRFLIRNETYRPSNHNSLKTEQEGNKWYKVLPQNWKKTANSFTMISIINHKPVTGLYNFISIFKCPCLGLKIVVISFRTNYPPGTRRSRSNNVLAIFSAYLKEWESNMLFNATPGLHLPAQNTLLEG